MTRIERIRELIGRTTAGEWLCHKIETSCGRAYRIGSGEMLVAGKGCCIIYDDYPSRADNDRQNNATFIAQSRQLVPELIALVEKQHEALEEMTSAVNAGKIDSPLISDNYGAWKFHEEWVQRAIAALAAYNEFNKVGE